MSTGFAFVSSFETRFSVWARESDKAFTTPQNDQRIQIVEKTGRVGDRITEIINGWAETKYADHRSGATCPEILDSILKNEELYVPTA